MKTTILKSSILIAFIFLNENKCNAQDIHFSQFSETPILRNPALAGIFSGDLRIQGVYRNQWNSVTVPYQTTSLNAEYKLPIATHVLPVLNYHKSLSADRNMYLSAGFAAGMVQRKFDLSKMTTNNQYNGSNYDPSLGTGETFANNSSLYFDGSAGISFNTQVGENPDNNIFFGVAYHHFNQSAKVSFYNNPDVKLIPKLVFSGGVKMSVNDYAYVTFHGDYSKQGPYSEVIGGMLYSFKLDDPTDPHYVISGGGFLRWKDAFIPVIKLEVSPLTFALSYDVNVSSLKASSQSQGGFELSIAYQKFVNKDNSSREAVRCPRF
jgi:type IX secretion system PorP/SprF family membrane protein